MSLKKYIKILAASYFFVKLKYILRKKNVLEKYFERKSDKSGKSGHNSVKINLPIKLIKLPLNHAVKYFFFGRKYFSKTKIKFWKYKMWLNKNKINNVY